jgi:hypothetical protein
VTWRILNLIAALALYVIAVNNTAYEITTPVEDPHHTLIRKIYAVGAFALLGVLLEKSHWPRLRGTFATALTIGLYSWAIEFGQIAIDRVGESFVQHGFDVLSGVAGGTLGGLALRAFERRPVRRIEIAFTVLMLAALALTFPGTYGSLAR